MEKKFCPFIPGMCRDDCAFKHHKTMGPDGLQDCLIAIKLSAINEMQHDDLIEICHAIKKD